MINFCIMNLIVGGASYLLIYKIFEFNDFIDSLMALFVMFFSQVVLTELFLGSLGILTTKNIIFVNALILLVILIFTKNKQLYFNFKVNQKQINGLLTDKLLLFAVSLVLGAALVKIGINLINPPFGWDNLNYHFTFPVEWLKHSNLDTPITVFDDPSPSYYPINGSLIFLWSMLPLKNVFLADLSQVPFFILAFMAVFSIGKKLGLETKNALLCACLFTLIPNYFKQLKVAYVDVTVAALFLVSINFLFLLNQRLSLRNTVVYSISTGLLLGTKTIALPYCILLLIPFLYILLKNISKSYFFIIFILIIFFLGGFSYLRNFLETANPLYPLDFNVGGICIFKGVMGMDIYRAHFRNEDYRIAKLLFHEGLGAQSLVFILPSIFLALPVGLIKMRKALNFNLLYFLILPLPIYLAYRYIIPLANTRYLYPLLGIGMLLGFYIIKIANVPEKITNVLISVSILASIPELAKRSELVWSILLAVLLFVSLPAAAKLILSKNLNLRKKMLFTFCLTISIMFFPLLQKSYLKNEYLRYITMQKYSGFWPDATCAWDWLNKNTTGNNIAYAGRPAPFPLYGTGFKNNVYYVSVNNTEPAKLHYFPDSRYKWGYDFLSLHKSLESRSNYRFGADYSVWLANLTRRNIEYLFVYSLHQTKDTIFPIEEDWAKGHPDKFIPVFTNKTIHIYKLA